MKHQWVAYVIVAVLSIGAGVAIAGLPNNVPVDATIVPPSTTIAPEPTFTTTTVEPTETTEPEPTETTEPETTDTTDPEPNGTTTTTVAIDRSIAIVAVNGADVAGTATRMVDRLEGLGYTDAVSRDGTQIEELTRVYVADGFEAAGQQLATELELADGLVLPIAEVPEVLDIPDAVDVVVYVGIDRAN